MGDTISIIKKSENNEGIGFDEKITEDAFNNASGQVFTSIVLPELNRESTPIFSYGHNDTTYY